MISINEYSNLTIEEINHQLSSKEGNAIIHHMPTTGNKKVVGIKDLHSNIDMPSTMSSNILKDYQAPFDSKVVSLLKQAGYHIGAVLNMDEFAMGSSNATSAFGGVDNIFSASHVAGGSSGGSAYAVAKGLVPVATGTDTGGSVRQPASLNGIYGYKPSYGLISRYGTISYASSFDTIGVLASNVDDLEEIGSVLIKEDDRDSTSFVPKDFSLNKEYDKPVLGIIKETLELDYDQCIKEEFDSKIEELKKDYQIVEISIPTIKVSDILYKVLSYGEAFSNLSRYDGIVFGPKGNVKEARTNFGFEVRRRIFMGAEILSYDDASIYKQAQRIRTRFINEVTDAFSKVDILVLPTTTYFDLAKDEKTTKQHNDSDKLLYMANMTGVPAMSIPFACKDKSWGLQIMSDKYQDHKLFNFAKNIKE